MAAEHSTRRSLGPIAVLVVVLALGVFVVRSEREPCRVHWHVGSIDPRFNVSELDVVNAATAAADRWNAAAGRVVLLYDQKHGIPLNLVYDSHHAIISTDRDRREQIRRVGDRITALKAQFDANPSEDLATRINGYIDQYNRLVTAYNETAAGEIQQGSYKRVLEVYAFADLTDLQFVMLHEFGHALGIHHINGAEAVMNPRHLIGTAESLQLRPADASALQALCSR